LNTPYRNTRCVDKCFFLANVTNEAFSYSRSSYARAGFAELHLTFITIVLSMLEPRYDVKSLAFQNLIGEVPIVNHYYRAKPTKNNIIKVKCLVGICYR
jgi:hypothetical protein